jgi:NitT/TauT family transport system substrate-binding protein
MIGSIGRRIGMLAAAFLALGQVAAAADKVTVGVFALSSSLPYFVALERGFFKEQNIEPETVRLMGGPPNVAALITNQIDAAAVLVTIEGMNANIKKPGVAMYIAVHSQNNIHQMEQFVVRKGYQRRRSRTSRVRRSCRRRGRRTSRPPRRSSPRSG